MFKIIVTVTIIFISLGYSYSQTAVIARKAKKAIYVGADSRVMYTADITPTRLVRDTGSSCKIFTCGKFNFATIGVEGITSRDEAFLACKNSKTFQEVILKYAESFHGKLEINLEILRNRSLLHFSELMERSPTPYISDMLFFGVESDSFFLSIVRFQLISPKTLPVKIQPSLSAAKTYLAIGYVEEITDTLKTSNVWKRGTSKTIISLIKIEDALHLEVGGDIDLIKVTKRKTKWIQRKQMCK